MNHFPSRTFRNATAVFLLLAATSALAGEGVLVGDVPQGMKTPAMLETAKRALDEESWTVLRSDGTSVDARRKHKGTDGSLTIFLSDGILKYRGAAKVSQAWGAGKDAKMVTVDGPIPEDWLDDLRSEIKRSLTIPVSQGVAPHGNTATDPGSNASTSNKPRKAVTGGPSNASTADKLRELDELRKEGLVSEPEYQQMRKAVLDAFPTSASPEADQGD